MQRAANPPDTGGASEGGVTVGIFSGLFGPVMLILGQHGDVIVSGDLDGDRVVRFTGNMMSVDGRFRLPDAHTAFTRDRVAARNQRLRFGFPARAVRAYTNPSLGRAAASMVANGIPARPFAWLHVTPHF